jgi:hypothetical protein
MSTAVAVPETSFRRRVVSFEQHVNSCATSIMILWSQLEETGITAREMYDLLQQPELKTMIVGVLQQLDRDQKRPLTVLRITQGDEGYDKKLLVVALTLVQKYHFPVSVMRNGRSKSGPENWLIVTGEPPDHIR